MIHATTPLESIKEALSEALGRDLGVDPLNEISTWRTTEGRVTDSAVDRLLNWNDATG